MKQFSKQLYKELNDELAAAFALEKQANKRLTSALSIIRRKISKLREFVEQKPFDNRKEEIHFFKYIKPNFYALLIYQVELFAIESSRPSAEKEKLKEYYLLEMDFVDRFFRQNSFHYEYYRLDASDLDNLYFIRGEKSQSILLPEAPEPHPEFSTNCDYLFSKFIAMEMLKDTLTEMVDNLSDQNAVIGELDTEMKWTGDKVNLAEIIYGIYFTGEVNHGKTDLATLTKWLGKIFQIDMKRIYSDYKDIRNRKVASPTRYLDRMRDSLYQRLEDENAFKPPSPLEKKIRL